MDRTPHVPSFHRSNFRSLSQSAATAYASTGGHTHTRLRSPYAPSTRPTDGHTLCWRGAGGGGAPPPPRGGGGPPAGGEAPGGGGGGGGRVVLRARGGPPPPPPFPP